MPDNTEAALIIDELPSVSLFIHRWVNYIAVSASDPAVQLVRAGWSPVGDRGERVTEPGI